jgi:hypothetical protein
VIDLRPPTKGSATRVDLQHRHTRNDSRLPITRSRDDQNPLADEVLYLVGHTEPPLWVADLSGGRFVNAHLLVRDSMLDSIAR